MSYADVRHWYEDRDDEPPPVGRHDHEPPHSVVVLWMELAEYDDVFNEYDEATDSWSIVTYRVAQEVPRGRWFPAERWAWKHAEAWRAAMAKRRGHAWIEDLF